MAKRSEHPDTERIFTALRSSPINWESPDTVHDVFRVIANAIEDRYGLRIETVTYSWIDASTYARAAAVVDCVSVVSHQPFGGAS